RTLVSLSPDTARAEKGLKTFLFARVYRHETVMVPVRESEAVVEALFAAYMRGAQMPGRWGDAMAQAGEDAGRARVVADFVAGMRDPYALDVYQRLFYDRPDFR